MLVVSPLARPPPRLSSHRRASSSSSSSSPSFSSSRRLFSPRATAKRLEASDFELLQKLGTVSLSSNASKTMSLYAARWASGEPLYRYPGDDPVDIMGPQCLIKEISDAKMAETEVKAYERLLEYDVPEIVVDEYGRGEGQKKQVLLPIVRMLAYFAAESMEEGDSASAGTSYYVVQEWTGMKRLAEYPQAKQKREQSDVKFWPPVERVQTHPTVLRFRFVRSALRQTARAVSFCHASGVAHNGIDAGTFFCDTHDDRDAFEERGEYGTRFRLANFGATSYPATEEAMSEDVRALGRTWAELVFSALARDGPSSSTSAEALSRQFEQVFDLDFDGRIWDYLAAESPNYDIARYFLKEKFGTCEECVWDVLKDAWLCDRSYSVTAASLARRLEKISSEADRVARGEIERETQSIKLVLPEFISSKLEKAAERLDEVIVQDPKLPEIPKPEWFEGKGEYAEGTWEDRIGPNYGIKEKLKNIPFIGNFLNDNDDEDGDDKDEEII